MKLSEAILLGSIGSKQGFGAMSSHKDSKDRCAIGAALLAVNQETDFLPRFQLEVVWPWVQKLVPLVEGTCSFTKDKTHGQVYMIIWQLNDILRWTRPQIAAWVTSIEPNEPQEGGIADNINLAEQVTEHTNCVYTIN